MHHNFSNPISPLGWSVFLLYLLIYFIIAAISNQILDLKFLPAEMLPVAASAWELVVIARPRGDEGDARNYIYTL
jgi:hypothetical protein